MRFLAPGFVGEGKKYVGYPIICDRVVAISILLEWFGEGDQANWEESADFLASFVVAKVLLLPFVVFE